MSDKFEDIIVEKTGSTKEAFNNGWETPTWHDLYSVTKAGFDRGREDADPLVQSVHDGGLRQAFIKSLKELNKRIDNVSTIDPDNNKEVIPKGFRWDNYNHVWKLIYEFKDWLEEQSGETDRIRLRLKR